MQYSRDSCLEQFKDSLQSICLYHCGHYRSIPLIIPSEKSFPCFQCIGNYRTLLQAWNKYEDILNKSNNFTIRVTPTFQFDVLCSYERLPYHERYQRIQKVLSNLKHQFDTNEPDRLRSLIADSRKKNPDNKITLELQQYNWELLESFLPKDVDSVPELAYRLDPDDKIKMLQSLPQRAENELNFDQFESLNELEREQYRYQKIAENHRHVGSIDDFQFPSELKMSNQNYMVLSLLNDPDYPMEPIVIFYRSFSQYDNQCISYVDELSKYMKPLDIFVIDMYTWGDLVSFDEVITDQDEQYMLDAKKQGKTIILASTGEELRKKMREQYDPSIPIINLDDDERKDA